MTISMASWWLIYGLRQIEKNSTLASLEVVRGERMLHWEGLSLILLILGGGFALLYYSLREFHRNKEIKEFDFRHYLDYPVFEVLKDESFCRKAKVFNGTVVWDEFTDIDPDSLYLESKPLILA